MSNEVDDSKAPDKRRIMYGFNAKIEISRIIRGYLFLKGVKNNLLEILHLSSVKCYVCFPFDQIE